VKAGEIAPVAGARFGPTRELSDPWSPQQQQAPSASTADPVAPFASLTWDAFAAPADVAAPAATLSAWDARGWVPDWEMLTWKASFDPSAFGAAPPTGAGFDDYLADHAPLASAPAAAARSPATGNPAPTAAIAAAAPMSSAVAEPAPATPAPAMAASLSFAAPASGAPSHDPAEAAAVAAAQDVIRSETTAEAPAMMTPRSAGAPAMQGTLAAAVTNADRQIGASPRIDIAASATAPPATRGLATRAGNGRDAGDPFPSPMAAATPPAGDAAAPATGPVAPTGATPMTVASSGAPQPAAQPGRVAADTPPRLTQADAPNSTGGATAVSDSSPAAARPVSGAIAPAPFDADDIAPVARAGLDNQTSAPEVGTLQPVAQRGSAEAETPSLRTSIDAPDTAGGAAALPAPSPAAAQPVSGAIAPPPPLHAGDDITPAAVVDPRPDMDIQSSAPGPRTVRPVTRPGAAAAEGSSLITSVDAPDESGRAPALSAPSLAAARPVSGTIAPLPFDIAEITPAAPIGPRPDRVTSAPEASTLEPVTQLRRAGVERPSLTTSIATPDHTGVDTPDHTSRPRAASEPGRAAALPVPDATASALPAASNITPAAPRGSSPVELTSAPKDGTLLPVRQPSRAVAERASLIMSIDAPDAIGTRATSEPGAMAPDQQSVTEDSSAPAAPPSAMIAATDAPFAPVRPSHEQSHDDRVWPAVGPAPAPVSAAFDPQDPLPARRPDASQPAGTIAPDAMRSPVTPAAGAPITSAANLDLTRAAAAANATPAQQQARGPVAPEPALAAPALAKPAYVATRIEAQRSSTGSATAHGFAVDDAPTRSVHRVDASMGEPPLHHDRSADAAAMPAQPGSRPAFRDNRTAEPVMPARADGRHAAAASPRADAPNILPAAQLSSGAPRSEPGAPSQPASASRMPAATTASPESSASGNAALPSRHPLPDRMTPQHAHLLDRPAPRIGGRPHSSAAAPTVLPPSSAQKLAGGSAGYDDLGVPTRDGARDDDLRGSTRHGDDFADPLKTSIAPRSAARPRAAAASADRLPTPSRPAPAAASVTAAQPDPRPPRPEASMTPRSIEAAAPATAGPRRPQTPERATLSPRLAAAERAAMPQHEVIAAAKMPLPSPPAPRAPSLDSLPRSNTHSTPLPDQVAAAIVAPPATPASPKPPTPAPQPPDGGPPGSETPRPSTPGGALRPLGRHAVSLSPHAPYDEPQPQPRPHQRGAVADAPAAPDVSAPSAVSPVAAVAPGFSAGGSARPTRASAAPPIRISIGKVSVQSPEVVEPSRPFRRPRPGLSLSEYLSRRPGTTTRVP
jgi:hypothetical protein